MTAFERVHSTKRSLGLIIGLSSILWGIAAGVGLWVLVALLASVIALPVMLLAALPVLSVLLGIGTAAYLLYRGRFAWSFDKVALWIEERAPQLRYALVTAIDPRYKESASLMEPVIAKVDTGPFVRDAAKKNVLPSVVASAIAIAVLLFLPDSLKEKMGDMGSILGGKKPPAVMGNRLVPLTGTVTSPAYSRRPVQQLKEPTTVEALQGSLLILTGEGAPDANIEITQTTPQGDGKDVVTKIPVTAGGEGWKVTIRMTDSLPSILAFKDRQYSRPSVIINPIVDQPPNAKLLLPIRDTTLRVKDDKISGTLRLSTDLRDDIGISSAYYEVVIADGAASGDGSITFRDMNIGRQSFNGQTAAKLDFNIPYANFKLQEGSIMQVRAIVFDNNGYASKPGRGVSDVRVIRVATSSEYDTLNINPAPPSADTALVTLKMLIIATRKLDSSREKVNLSGTPLEKKRFKDSSYKLGAVSDRVRGIIQRIIDEQTGGGEIDADWRLTEAADSMWSSSRSLYIYETHVALPAMVRAHKLLLDYSNTARYYLRGVLRPEPVNIDRVRLTGKDSAIVATERTARGLADIDRARMSQAYANAMRTLGTNKTAAAEQLTMLQVEALRKYPVLATALGDATKAIREGKDASQPLLRARRFLEGKAGTLSRLPAWSGAW